MPYTTNNLAIKTGMRQGELLGLKWQDISWRKGSLTVRRQVQWVPGQGFVFGEPKTKAGNRSVKLGEGTLQALREHIERQQAERVVAWQSVAGLGSGVPIEGGDAHGSAQFAQGLL